MDRHADKTTDFGIWVHLIQMSVLNTSKFSTAVTIQNTEMSKATQSVVYILIEISAWLVLLQYS